MSNNPYKQSTSSQKSPVEEAGPPSYDTATTSTNNHNNLAIPNLQSNNSYDGSTASSDNTHEGSEENGIPRDVLAHIRNENRELPTGYIREFDPV